MTEQTPEHSQPKEDIAQACPDAMTGEQQRFRRDLLRALNEVHQVAEQTQDILDSQHVTARRVEFLSNFLDAARQEAKHSKALRLFRTILGRCPAESQPPQGPVAIKTLTLDTVNAVLSADPTLMLSVPPNTYAGHDWYLQDRAFSDLRRHLRNSAAWRFSPNCVRDRARLLFDMTAPYIDLPDKRFCDLGCGVHHPLGTATVMYLNGAQSTLSVDISPADSSQRAAEALYDLLVDCLAHPADWHWSGIPRDEFLDRVRSFDLGAFRDGNMEGGIGNLPLRHLVGDVCNGIFEARGIDLMTSWAVLEHFLDFPTATTALFNAMDDGAIAFHTVDMADHRALPDPDNYHRWSFLTEDEDWSDGLTNRLRFSEVLAHFEKAGFEILHRAGEQAPLPEGLREGLKGRFRDMSDDELSHFSLNCVIRKPGR